MKPAKEEFEPLWSWIETTQDIEDLGDFDVSNVPDIQQTRVLKLTCCGQDVEIRVELLNEFPLRLPLIRIHPPRSLGLLPHVDEYGVVCFVESEGLLLDASQPDAILEQSVDLARQVISQGLMGTNVKDFSDEFDAYWGRLHPHREVALLHAHLDTQPCRLRVVIGTWRKQTRTVICLEGSEAHVERRLFERVKNTYDGIYVPLEADPYPIPPTNPETCWNPPELMAFLTKHVSAENRLLFDSMMNDMPRKRRHVLVLGVRRQDGGRSFVGVGWCSHASKSRGPQIRFPLTHEATSRRSSQHSTQSHPIVFRRIDPEFLVERGGGQPSLLTKHVMVVGCGAVGSVIAELLVKIGVGKLSLVDFDLLELGNIHRNQLGAQFDRMQKVTALAHEFSKRFPHLETYEYIGRIERLLHQNPCLFDALDLVIFATGNHTIELEMNERLHSRISTPPTIFTWLEPLGVGGHALVTNIRLNSNQTGCFQCLFENREDGILWNKASFAAPKQSFSKRTSGCNTSFVSFGGIDATRTACLAAELAQRILLGTHHEHSLVSWKGDSSEFENEGFVLSSRYSNSTQDTLDQARLYYKSPVCPICS